MLTQSFKAIAAQEGGESGAETSILSKSSLETSQNMVYWGLQSRTNSIKLGTYSPNMYLSFLVKITST